MAEELTPSTIWSQIRDAAGGDRERLNALIARYRSLVVSFLRRRGCPESDAEDVAQEVLVRISREEYLRKADSDRGRFGDLLYTVTRRTLADHWERENALKRGGGRDPVPLRPGESAFEGLEPAAPVEQDEFDRLWAQGLLSRALERLRDECSARGSSRFDAIRLTQYDGLSYRDAAERLGRKESDVTNDVHLAKTRLKELLGDEVRSYCSTEEEWRDEMRAFAR